MFTTKKKPLKKITKQDTSSPLRAGLLITSGAAAGAAGMAARMAKVNFEKNPSSFFDKLEQALTKVFNALPESMRHQPSINDLRNKITQTIREAKTEYSQGRSSQNQSGPSRSAPAQAASVRSS